MTLNELKILSVLSKGPNYGIGIINQLEKVGLEINEGGIYNTLSSMLDKGTIKEQRSQKVNGIFRRFYEITDKGTSEFSKQMGFLKLWVEQ